MLIFEGSEEFGLHSMTEYPYPAQCDPYVTFHDNSTCIFHVHVPWAIQYCCYWESIIVTESTKWHLYGVNKVTSLGLH